MTHEQAERMILLLERIAAIQDGRAVAYTGLPTGDGFPAVAVMQGELPELAQRRVLAEPPVQQQPDVDE